MTISIFLRMSCLFSLFSSFLFYCLFLSLKYDIFAKIMDFDTGDHTMVCNSLGEVIIIFQTVQIVCQLVVAMQFPQ